MKKLAELLDQNWEGEYKHYLDAQICDERNENYLDVSTPSSFQQFLTQQAWLPPDDMYSNTSKSLFAGHELFDNTQQVHSLLHSHVPYIGAELKSEDLVNCLHIKRSVSASDMIDYLLQWSRESRENGTPFCTSIEHMSHVYMFLKRESEDHAYSSARVSSDGEPGKLHDIFQEEELIFVPDKYQENSTKLDVDGHFQTIHSVCWMDPSTVLYVRQKLSLSLSANLPKVLSLYYSMREDQGMSNQLQRAFIHFGIPEMPRVASYLTLLKYISTLSHHPEPEHVKDFTSIAFELVQLCNTDTSISPDFIYNNLKNAKVFPTQNNVWVSLQECLLENDDKSIAKCFQKSDKVFFILWPDVINKKKSRDISRQQSLANQEARDEFIKLCKISKLSTKVTPRVDYGGEARPVDKVKSQLSSWVTLIQQFAVANCEDLYTQLKMDGVQDKLCRLQVLSVMSLSCRYFIDHHGSQIASPGTIEKGCEYVYDGDTSTIYIAADKVEKPGSLLPALMKLFAQTSSNEDSNAIESFLKSLLLECPTTSNELDDFAAQHNLQCLPPDEPVWKVPLPLHQHYKEEEETTTDEEEGESSSEEDEMNTKLGVEGIDREIPEEGKRLTSWPPKAAVDPSAVAPRHSKQFPDSIKDQLHSPDLSASVIGEDELREARKKHLLEYDDDSSTAKSELQEPCQHILGKRRPDEHASPSGSLCNSEHLKVPCYVSTDNTESMTINVQGHTHRSSKVDTSQEAKRHKLGSEQTSAVQGHDQNKDHQYIEESKWKAIKRVESLTDLIDIQGIVQSFQGGDKTPLVEMLEDISADDPESLLKIGRWGEQYVYTLLENMEHLPDGSHVKSISWINKDGETYMPYDIAVELEGDNPTQQCRSIYIEVKSTASNEKEHVSISWNQLKFAEEHGEDYHLYRVYSAGRPHSHLCMLENLHSFIKSHHVRFSFVL